MVWWLCGTSWREQKTSVELRDRMVIEATGSVPKRNKLRWFGHMERKEKEDWVIGCMYRVYGGPEKGHTHVFDVQEFNWAVLDIVRFKQMSEIQDGSLKIGFNLHLELQTFACIALWHCAQY